MTDVGSGLRERASLLGEDATARGKSCLLGQKAGKASQGKPRPRSSLGWECYCMNFQKFNLCFVKKLMQIRIL